MCASRCSHRPTRPAVIWARGLLLPLARSSITVMLLRPSGVMTEARIYGEARRSGLRASVVEPLRG